MCVEVAHRSEHGAAAGGAELRHQRPADPLLPAHHRLCPPPLPRPQTTAGAPSSL